MFRKFEVQESIAVKKLPLYRYDQVGTTVEYLAVYQARNWRELKAGILHDYRAQDTQQRMFTVTFLEELTSEQKGSTGKIHQFVGTFTAVSTRLNMMEILSEYQEIKPFQGRPHLHLMRNLVSKFKQDVNAPELFKGKFDINRRKT